MAKRRHPRADLIQTQRRDARAPANPTPPKVAAELAAKRRADGYANVLTGLGGSRDKSLAARVRPFVPLQWQELDWLYHGNDLPATIVDRLPTDAMRMGYESGNPELDKIAQKWDALDKFLEGWIWGRLYGLGGLYLGFSDRLGAQDTPLDLAAIQPGDLTFILPVDGIDLGVAERVTNPASAHYGDVRSYYLGTVNAGTRQGTPIHRSRFILFGGARTSARTRLRNGERDLSVLQRPADVLRDVDQSWRSVMNLLQDLSQAVFKVKGLIQQIQDGQKDVLLARMEIVDVARSVARAVVIDADGEGFEHAGAANVTGVDPLLVRIFTRLAAAAEMPLTILMGTSPAGMNATGESDLRIWYAHCETARKRVNLQIETLYRVLAANAGIVWEGGGTWPSLYQATEQEQGALDLQHAQTDALNVSTELMTAEEATMVRFGGMRPEDAVNLAQRKARLANVPEDTAGGQITVNPGEIWTDTADTHRIEVTAAVGGNVYFLDLDSPTPTRQYAWRLASFLERCRPPAGDPAPTP